MNDLQKELAEFIKGDNIRIYLKSDEEDDDGNIEEEVDDEDESRGPWFVEHTCPFNDYCREIVEPGSSNKNYPDGAVGIRVDDDFWVVASIPYKFKELTCEQICTVLFPNAKNPTYMADSGSIEQMEEAIKHYEIALKEVKAKYPENHRHWEYYQDMLGYSRNRLYERVNGIKKED